VQYVSFRHQLLSRNSTYDGKMRHINQNTFVFKIRNHTLRNYMRRSTNLSLSGLSLLSFAARTSSAAMTKQLLDMLATNIQQRKQDFHLP